MVILLLQFEDNILQFSYCKDQNKDVHKGQVFVLSQVNCDELESL